MTPAPARRPLRIRIEGTSLPGRTWCEHDHVHVGVQCRSDPVDLIPGDAAEATFEFDVDILPDDSGAWDFRGPYVHGKRGERFLYLTWGDQPPGGDFTMFRRAKLAPCHSATGGGQGPYRALRATGGAQAWARSGRAESGRRRR